MLFTIPRLLRNRRLLINDRYVHSVPLIINIFRFRRSINVVHCEYRLNRILKNFFTSHTHLRHIISRLYFYSPQNVCMLNKKKGRGFFLETRDETRNRRDVSSTSSSPPPPRTSGALNDVTRYYGSLAASSAVSGTRNADFSIYTG